MSSLKHNPVAKNAKKFNKSKVFKDRKKESIKNPKPINLNKLDEIL